MAAFNFHRRKTRRRWYAGATLVAAALFAVLYVAGASATLTGSPYNGADGALDSGIAANADDPSGANDNSFGQGSNEDDPNVTIVTGSIPPNKNDLTNFYEASTSTNTGVFIYLGWSRAVNIGNANLDFEINKSPTPSGCTIGTNCWDGSTTGKLTINRSAGDVLVTYDFGGSGTPTLGVNRWLLSATNPSITGFATNTCLSANSFPCWGDHKDLTTGSGGNSEAAVSSDGLFGEAVINLTDAGVLTASSCDFGRATTFLKSRSSSSFKAELKDFIAPVSTPLSPCASLTVIKDTQNSAGTRAGDSQSFTFTPSSNLNSGSTFNLADATGSDVACPATTCNKITFGSLGAGTYTATETTNSAYTLTSISCVNTGTTTAHGTGNTATGVASVTLGLGDDVTCTFTNKKNKIASALDTAPWVYPNDQATVSNNATGTVTFKLYGATAGGNSALQNCVANGGTVGQGGLLYKETVTLPGSASNNSVNTSNYTNAHNPDDSVKINSSGTQVYWRAAYTPASTELTFNGRDSHCEEYITPTLQANTTAGGFAP